MSHRVLNPEGYDEAVRLYLSGLTLRATASAVGCRWNNVLDELKRRGIPRRSKFVAKKSILMTFSSAQLRAVMADYEESGDPMKVVGARHGISGWSVKRIVQQFGGVVRGRGRPKGRSGTRRDRDAAIRVLRAAGWTLAEIAAVVALGSRQRIHQILSEEPAP